MLGYSWWILNEQIFLQHCLEILFNVNVFPENQYESMRAHKIGNQEIFLEISSSQTVFASFWFSSSSTNCMAEAFSLPWLNVLWYKDMFVQQQSNFSENFFWFLFSLVCNQNFGSAINSALFFCFRLSLFSKRNNKNESFKRTCSCKKSKWIVHELVVVPPSWSHITIKSFESRNRNKSFSRPFGKVVIANYNLLIYFTIRLSR